MLRRVTEILVENNCGSLIVVDKQGSRKMIGIITERDILRACSKGISLDDTLVEEAMTTNMIIGQATDTITDAMGLMTVNRVRHLPVVEDDELVGVISIGDLVKVQHNRLTAENHYLKNYIQS
jgi:CBS domain-containing protein